MASQVESIKWLPGTRFMVDGFAFANPRCQHYFLTHFHSDHTVGLRRGFDAGLVYASPVTAALLTLDFGLRPDVVRVLEVNVRAVVEGVGVTPIDANHCPGAVMFLFEVPREDGSVEVILHTGDCRWQDWIKDRSVLSSIKVDTLFLDTTYCQPRHDFPPQQVAINAMVQAIREAQAQEPATLVVVSSYHIGKERAFFGAARQLDCKIYCTKAKRKVLALLGLPESDMELLTDEPSEAGVHVAAAMGMRHESLARYITPEGPWKQVVGVRPTGWTFRKSAGTHSVWREGATVIIGVPYSEHSSWSDLRACVAAIRPKRLVPTVNARDAAASRAIVDRFAGLMDLSRDRSRLDVWLKAEKPQRVLLPLGPPPLAPGEMPMPTGDSGGCTTDSQACAGDAAERADSAGGCFGATAAGVDGGEDCLGTDAACTCVHSRVHQATCSAHDDGGAVAHGAAWGTANECSSRGGAETAMGVCCANEGCPHEPGCHMPPTAACAAVDAPSTNAANKPAPTPCPTTEPTAPGDELADVDLEEQARIWEQLQRHKRIREAAAAQQQASKKARRRSSQGSSSSGGSAQTQQQGAASAADAAPAAGGSQSSIKAFFGFFAGRR